MVSPNSTDGIPHPKLLIVSPPLIYCWTPSNIMMIFPYSSVHPPQYCIVVPRGENIEAKSWFYNVISSPNNLKFILTAAIFQICYVKFIQGLLKTGSSSFIGSGLFTCVWNIPVAGKSGTSYFITENIALNIICLARRIEVKSKHNNNFISSYTHRSNTPRERN